MRVHIRDDEGWHEVDKAAVEVSIDLPNGGQADIRITADDTITVQKSGHKFTVAVR